MKPKCVAEPVLAIYSRCMINQFGVVYKKISDGNFTPVTLHIQGKISVEKINKHGNTIGKIFYRMNGHQLFCKSHSCKILQWQRSRDELKVCIVG